jgi:hypothetical protein
MPDPVFKPAAPVLRSHRLDYAPPLTIRERIARHLPAADAVVGFLKTLVWVAPLTLLIWVYAEREQNVTQSGIIVPIEVRTNDPNRIVTLRGPADKNVVLELYGPRAKVDHIRDLLRPGANESAPLVIDIDPKITSGENKTSTIEQINNNPIFKNNGITVKRAEPPNLVVDIDTFEDRTDVQIRPSPESAKLLAEKPAFVPDTVNLRAPKSVIESHPDELFVNADLANREELKSTTNSGKVTLDRVRLYWPVSRDNVHITPQTISATVVLKAAQDAKYTIKSVSIFKTTPSGFENQFDVIFKDTISNVEVTGPREQIDTIDKTFKPVAVFEVTAFDKNGTIYKPLEFKLPPGVTLVPGADSTNRAANWEVTKRPK